MKKTAFILCFILIFPILTVCFSCGGKNADRTLYEIECSLDENVINGKEKVEYFNDSSVSVKELKFNLFANAFKKDAKYRPISTSDERKAYPNGVNYGGIEILSVKSESGDLDYSVCGEDQNILSVKLDTEVYPEEDYTLFIEYKITLANVIARTGINDKTINLANFYPILCARDENGFYECIYYEYGDPYYSDCADYKVTFTHKEDYSAAASGKLIKSEKSGGTVKNLFAIDNARSFSITLSKEFKTISAKIWDVDVTYYFYNDETPQNTFEKISRSIELFSEKFGKYPYKTYSVAQSKFIQGGMEYPAMVIISDELDASSRGEVAVHETAHQWWQTVVGNNEIKYPFLDEALAEYSTVIYYEKYPEGKLNRENMIRSSEQTYKTFCSVSDVLYQKTDTSMLRAINEYKTEYEYVNIAYIKGCIMFEYLRKSVGDKVFFESLKNYYEEYAYKNAVPDDLVGCFERAGADANGFFDSFFSGKAII